MEIPEECKYPALGKNHCVGCTDPCTIVITECELMPPYQRHSPTSKAAAKSMKEGAGNLRVKLLLWLGNAGPSTDWEMQVGIPMEANTQRPRRRECQQRGLIRDSGRKRKSPSGRNCVVWEVT